MVVQVWQKEKLIRRCPLQGKHDRFCTLLRGVWDSLGPVNALEPHKWGAHAIDVTKTGLYPIRMKKQSNHFISYKYRCLMMSEL